MVLIVMGGYYIVTTFTLSYVTGQLGVPRNVSLKGLLLAGAAQTAGILIFSWVADRAGTRVVAIWSAACIFLFSYPYFWLVDTRRPDLIWLAMGVWMFAEGSLYGITGVYLAGLFPARVRYSGISFSYQMAGMLGGALAPIISTALIHWAGGASWPVATYLAITALISLIAVYWASDRYSMKIHDTEPIERRVAGEHG
jgi:MHS family shikimate/dehydroshikimate transporter-like MFS transporter